MGDDATIERARREAADWLTALNNRMVTTQALLDFRQWRKVPVNADAYSEVERAWREAAELAGDPDIVAATAAAGSKPARPPLPGYLVGPAGRTVLALLVVGAIGAAVSVARGPGRTYDTAVGEQRLIRLTDGSRVRLDTATRVQVAFRGGERRVLLLRGQAFFEVAHDPARPFLVEADGATVRALGTRFDVRRDPEGVQVTLVEGRVRVRRGGGEGWTLAPGQQIRVGAKVASPAPRAVEAGAATSWTTGRLVFRGLPLAAAVAEVNRYATRPVRLEAQAVAATPVTGAFDSGDTDAFVAAVCALYDLRADQGADGDVILRPAG